MKTINAMAIVSAALLGTLLPNAKADEFNQKTALTFSGPVEVPGEVLPAGTYIFVLASTQADRDVVQVFSKHERHLYATFIAIPDYRLTPKKKAAISFEERAVGAPQAVRAWFCPGENCGHDFVYPKERAVAMAKPGA